MSYVARVSKEGVDVKTAGTLDLTLDSETNNLKIRTVGTINYNSVTNSGRGTVNHNLGYTPSYLSFFKVGTSTRWYTTGSKESQSGNNVMVLGRSNGSQLLFDTSTSTGGSVDVTVSYLLNVDPAL